MNLTRYEQETVINFNAGEEYASIYTRDRTVMRRLDALVNEFPDVYRLVHETSVDRVYSVPKTYVSYRKPRRMTEEQRENARARMMKVNRIQVDSER